MIYVYTVLYTLAAIYNAFQFMGQEMESNGAIIIFKRNKKI